MSQSCGLRDLVPEVLNIPFQNVPMSLPREVWEANQVWIKDSVDIVDCIIDGSMQNGELRVE